MVCASKWGFTESNSAKTAPTLASLECSLLPDSSIDCRTVQAYLETHYCVLGDTPLTLRVGTANPLLGELHKSRRVESSAFITACNPFSQACDETVNVQRQAALARELTQRSLHFIEATGQHPSNQGPGEPSFLVLGLAREAAKMLGARLEQNAILWCGADAVPELVLLR